jgi:chemotaxis protein methyltransferase CheR
MLASGAPVTQVLEASPWRVREPTEREFRRLAELIQDASGIALNGTKRALVMRRLSPRIRALGLDSIAEYTTHVGADATGRELIRLLDLIATNETHFFREPQHFEYLATQVFPAWTRAADAGDRGRDARVWSAACSTGQETYSLAMQMLACLPAEQGWRIDVLGSDISTTALATARSAEWPIGLAKEIPKHYLQRFMLKGMGHREGRMRAAREVRDVVRFARLNLNEEHYDVPGGGTFDLIFCRNVLIYFSPEGRAAVIDRIIDRLAPGGLLFVGHAESLHVHRDRLRALMPTVYTRCA